jgi:hypothetical protein
MFAKKEWFQRRKYGGWGVSPKTWQGWIYIAIMIIPFIVFQSLPYWTTELRMYVTIGWVIFLLLDIMPVMITVYRDEREFKIESMAERNAAWFMMSVLVLGVLYEVITSALRQQLSVNVFMVIAVFGGALVKTISNIVYERKPI